MDRFTTVIRRLDPGEGWSAYNYRMVDRFGPIFKDKDKDRLNPMGWMYKLSGDRVPRYHRPEDARRRVRVLNDSHLKAWIETNYPQVTVEFSVANLAAAIPWIFKAWVRVRYPHLLTRFAADNDRRIKAFTEKNNEPQSP